MRALVSSIPGRISRAAADALRLLARAKAREPTFWLIVCGCLLVAGICVGTIMMIGELIVATNTVAAALADWRAQTRFLVAAAALSASLIALILFLIIKQITRQNRETQRQLEAEKHRLDTALNNMTQGLVQYDASARIVTFNQRYIDMYNLSKDVVKPGLHYYDLIQHRRDTGSYDGDVHSFCDPIMRDIAEGKVSRTVMETGDGRAYYIVNKPRSRRADGSRRSRTSPSGATSSRSATATMRFCARSSTISPPRSP
jgi:PAS domain-containing protein